MSSQTAEANPGNGGVDIPKICVSTNLHLINSKHTRYFIQEYTSWSMLFLPAVCVLTNRFLGEDKQREAFRSLLTYRPLLINPNHTRYFTQKQYGLVNAVDPLNA